jgi:hypothetical protein
MVTIAVVSRRGIGRPRERPITTDRFNTARAAVASKSTTTRARQFRDRFASQFPRCAVGIVVDGVIRGELLERQLVASREAENFAPPIIPLSYGSLLKVKHADISFKRRHLLVCAVIKSRRSLVRKTWNALAATRSDIAGCAACPRSPCIQP